MGRGGAAARRRSRDGESKKRQPEGGGRRATAVAVDAAAGGAAATDEATTETEAAACVPWSNRAAYAVLLRRAAWAVRRWPVATATYCWAGSPGSRRAPFHNFLPF